MHGDNAGMDDDVNSCLRHRWKALGDADALFCRPYLDMDAESARQKLDREGLLGELVGKNILCLAGGGGQQSVAFALLGARVTVLDLDRGQLDRDRFAAAHHEVVVLTEQGDMRDLSRFREAAFDIVWHPYSMNFVPEIEMVVRHVSRVLRPGGTYTFAMANPFAAGVSTRDWNGEGYVLRLPYIDRARYEFDDEDWVHSTQVDVPAPIEFVTPLARRWRVLRTLV
jgi:2-polyprenyl-3-methyl-5-hydroxy-6-metoxy-1,4-benzoquinol methylase